MFAQTDRPLTLTTPLGADKFLLLGFQGREAISELFRFELQAAWQDTKHPLEFDKLLGQSVTIQLLAGENKRYINGMVSRITQGYRDENFIYYVLEVVPRLWLLDRKLSSRIFQQLTVPDILTKLFLDQDINTQIHQEFQPREYCVQYRETDLAFASRLMEEEGIYYYFEHASGGHLLVISDTPQAHPSIPYLPTAIWEDGMHAQFEADRVFNWNKDQQIRSSRFTTWDYNFQIQDKHLEASKDSLDSVMVGSVEHKLNVVNERLELYDYPGGYATKVDAVRTSGQDQPWVLDHIFFENKHIAGIRMQQETVPALQIRSDGWHAAFTAGYTFELTRHFSDNGKFVITSVEHVGKQPLNAHDPVGAVAEPFEYSNSFTCIPIGLPYRPPRVTPIPSIKGVQSAIVVGPPGEEIFTDKYGRVKVEFHWDREEKANYDSSCWVRVATYWAGTQWGGVHVPRIGQEVLVDFLDGDVDKPIIVGSLYNPKTMPPWALPDNMTISGTKSRSTPHGGASNFNELSFEDKKGKELVNFQAEKDLASLIKNNESRTVGNDRTAIVKHDETKTVTNNESTTVDQGDQSILLNMGNQSTKIKMGNQSTLVDMGDQATKCTLGKIETEAMQSIELKVGQSSIKIDQMGVTIKGMMITIDAQVQAQVKSIMTQVSGSAMVQVQGGIVMIN